MLNLHELIDWIVLTSGNLKYGHIDISITKHQGEVVKIIKNVEEIEKIPQKKKDDIEQI